MTTDLGVGLIGFGYAGATFHAPLILATAGLRLAAVVSQHPEKVQNALPAISIETSPESLWIRPDVDVVVIATPNDTHYALARQALAAGKHVVVDKPFTVTVGEAQELAAQAERTGRILSAFHNRRWDSDFLTLREVISAGSLGRIVHFESHFDRYRPEVRARWREKPGQGTGLWYDLGPHLLDQALVLFGKPQALQLDLACQRAHAEVDDWFHAVLHYGGMRAILHASALTPRAAPRFMVHGDQGTFVKQGLDVQEDALKEGRRPPAEMWGLDPLAAELTLWREGGPITQTMQGRPGNYAAYYEAFRDAVLARRPNPVPPEEAIAVMTLIEQGMVSAEAQRVVRLD